MQPTFALTLDEAESLLVLVGGHLIYDRLNEFVKVEKFKRTRTELARKLFSENIVDISTTLSSQQYAYMETESKIDMMFDDNDDLIVFEASFYTKNHTYIGNKKVTFNVKLGSIESIV